MITTLEQFQEQYDNFLGEFMNRVKGGDKIFPTVQLATRLDKPMRIYTNNREENTLQKVTDEGEYYQLNFPRFNKLQKQYDDDFAWYLDMDTVFFFERPYVGKVMSVLKKLLPNSDIVTFRNDIIINGTKVGPTLVCGEIQDYYNSVENIQNSGIIYCLRWTNLEGLNEIFEGNNNHEQRLISDKAPLGTLDQFLDISKEEFEKLLEE